MRPTAEQVETLAERCEQFRDSKAQDGYKNSLALCIVDSVQSTGVTYVSVENVVSRYRAFREKQGGDAETDSAQDLADTFTALGGHEAWADEIGNDNKTSTHAGAPLKAFAIEAEANVLIGEGIITAENLRDAAADPDEIARIKREWLKIPGQGPGTTWHYVQMLAGIEGIKPDRMIIRFVADALGLKRNKVTANFCVEALTAVAKAMKKSATDLDYGIWEWQRTQ